MSSDAVEHKTRSAVAKDAFEEVVTAFSHDMPLIMHGSGEPSKPNPASVRLLSELTANYIGNLVEAAVDAHAILNNGQYQPLPPPPFPRDSSTRIPPPPSDDDKRDTGKKRRRAIDEFWDEPLKEPKIKNKTKTKTKTVGEEEEEQKEEGGVPIDEWVGVSGVDFFEKSRIRKAYVSTPSSLTASSFIFPICHDPGLYGRVLEVQRMTRRSIAPILVDPVVKFVVQEEGASHGPGALRKRDTNVAKEGENDEPEDSDSEEEDGAHGAAWPGLEEMLPVHVTADFIEKQTTTVNIE